MSQQDERVQAIRKHPKVGEGSCTVIDECYTDAELIEELDEDGITTPEGAVEWALEIEGLKVEQALNARWGEDDDPELERWREWND